MDGGIRYQPPSLKCMTTILLDKINPNPTPNVNLYQSVQRVVDKLRDLVEDKVLGLEFPGKTYMFKVVLYLIESFILW